MKKKLIKIKHFEKLTCIFVITALFIIPSVASVNIQQVRQEVSQVCESLNLVQENPIWEVEYSESFTGLRVATDSENNVIMVGPGSGGGTTELPFGVIVKYGPNGDFIWSDHRSYSILDGFILQSYKTAYVKQLSQICTTIPTTSVSQGCKTASSTKSSNGITVDLTKEHQYLEPVFPNAPASWRKWIRFYDVAVDSNDDIIVVGEVQHRNTEDQRTVYIIKYNSDGKRLWSRIYKRYSLEPRDLATGVAIDSNDNIFISIRSQNKDTDKYNGLVLKLSSNSGSTLDEALYDGTSTVFYDLATDSNDNVFVAGHYPSSNAMKVIKYSNSLTLLDEWSTSALLIEPWAINVDPNDNVIVAGSAGFSGNKKQYVVKFSSDGNVLWSNTSTENGVLCDEVAISQDVTAVTGMGGGELEWKFYVGLYDESGTEFKRLLGGNVTLAQVFISHGIDVDNNGDIVVSGFRNYYYYQYYMYAMKFHQ